jgi:hypothetical protein
VLNQDRSSMQCIFPYRDPRSDLPSWCLDWSVAGSENGILFNDSHWQASGSKGLVYSRPSMLTLALQGVIVTEIKICNESFLRWWTFDCHGLLVWFENSEERRTCFGPQGLKLDHGAKHTILKLFECILLPEIDKPGRWDGGLWDGASPELLSMLNRPHSDLIALLVPIYLAAVDPELFEMIRLEIDAQLPLGDHPVIRTAMAGMLYGANAGANLFVTKDGKQGAGYPGIRQGDLICIICGSKTPQILRRVNGGADERYILVGACNVDGLMYGEGLEMGLTEREFILV